VADTLSHTTQQPQEMNIHVPCGIRTRDLSNQAASGLRYRPYGHRARQFIVYLVQMAGKKYEPASPFLTKNLKAPHVT
jgi:hypothetical protein